jgi:hypothetical protein
MRGFAVWWTTGPFTSPGGLELLRKPPPRPMAKSGIIYTGKSTVVARLFCCLEHQDTRTGNLEHPDPSDVNAATAAAAAFAQAYILHTQTLARDIGMHGDDTLAVPEQQ